MAGMRKVGVVLLVVGLLVPALTALGQSWWDKTERIGLGSYWVYDKSPTCCNPPTVVLSTVSRQTTCNSSPVRIFLYNVPRGKWYLYIFNAYTLIRLFVFENQAKVNFEVVPPPEGWGIGTYFIKAVLTNKPLWGFPRCLPVSVKELKYEAPDCSTIIEVEEISFTVSQCDYRPCCCWCFYCP